MVKPRQCQIVERDSLGRAHSRRIQESILANLELHKLPRKVKKFCQNGAEDKAETTYQAAASSCGIVNTTT